jgi:hypothetical protein
MPWVLYYCFTHVNREVIPEIHIEIPLKFIAKGDRFTDVVNPVLAWMVPTSKDGHLHFYIFLCIQEQLKPLQQIKYPLVN